MKILAVLHLELFADILTSLFAGVVATLSISKALSEWGSSAILTWFLIARYDTSVKKHIELATKFCYPKSAALLTEILMKKSVVALTKIWYLSTDKILPEVLNNYWLKKGDDCGIIKKNGNYLENFYLFLSMLKNKICRT